MPNRILPRAAIVALFAVLLAACSGVTSLEKPQLELVSVGAATGDLFEQRVTVRLRVTNPNDRVLPVRGLTVAVELEGQKFADGVSARAFDVPARGQAEFDMEMRADAVGGLVQLVKRRGAGAREARYVIRGKVETKLGFVRSVPFEDAGVIPLGR
ncbi:MAG: LEA type 2 family protein [Gammaproteobacteria bacterium]|nr:LEA type 2 family protein [Gammaproteobacteria bacterium]